VVKCLNTAADQIIANSVQRNTIFKNYGMFSVFNHVTSSAIMETDRGRELFMQNCTSCIFSRTSSRIMHSVIPTWPVTTNLTKIWKFLGSKTNR